MTVKQIKLGNKYTITSTTYGLSGADKLGLKLGDEIDAGDGRFIVDEVGQLRLIPELVKAGTSGIVACTRHLTKSGKHQLQAGDTVTIKKGIPVGRHNIAGKEGWQFFNGSMTAMCGKDFVIKYVTYSGTYHLEGAMWNWANEWLTFKSPKPYVASVKTPVETSVKELPVTHVSQPTNPFDRKDLTIPDWATHAGHHGDTGTWYFFNMKPEQYLDRPYFKLGFDNRSGFKWEQFSHNYQHTNWKDSVVERTPAYVPFKIGELVRVKDISVGRHESAVADGGNSFVDSMRQFVGKTFKVSSNSNYSVRLDGNSWNYLPDWLERVEITKEPLTLKQLLKQRQQTFKVGDRVVLVGSTLGDKTLDGSATYSEYKQAYQGKVLTVSKIWGCDCDISIRAVTGESIWVSPDWIVKESEYPVTAESGEYSHYFKDVSKLATIDVYQVLSLFNVTNPCLQHIVKKALVTGGRTAGKDFSQDLREIRDTAIRAVEMEEQSKS